MSQPWLDVSCVQAIGDRKAQEDNFRIGSFNDGAASHVSVIADGMGGHVHGALAAEAVVSEFMDAVGDDGATSAKELKSAVIAGNIAIANHVREHPDHEGMGSTVVGVSVLEDQLLWVSVGDSPLYLFSEAELRRLNADHSLAPQIDAAAERGEITAEEARASSSRHVLRSAITGGDIALIDAPPDGHTVKPGDLIILASDGLDTIGHQELADLLASNIDNSASDIADALVSTVIAKDAPRQDNITVLVIRIGGHGENDDDVPTRPISP